MLVIGVVGTSRSTRNRFQPELPVAPGQKRVDLVSLAWLLPTIREC